MSIKVHNTTVAKDLVKFLKEKGLTDNGIAGLLGNLDAESALYLNNLQNSYNIKFEVTDEEYTREVNEGKRNFIDSAGYGLAQWTSKGRKQKLLNYARTIGKSIDSEEVQFEFLYSELETSYKSTLSVLTDETKTISDCARKVMIYYEAPKNQSEENQLRRVENAEAFYKKYIEGEAKPTIMGVKKFVEKAIDIATNYKTHYIYGCFGAPMNEKNKTRYSANNSYNREQASTIKSLSEDTFGFDCVCLIKGILWGWNGDLSKTYGGAVYCSNNVPDVGANTMCNRYLQDVTTDFSNIIVGEAVWVEGHIGIYIGDGKVVECTPKWENKVQITSLKNLGYNEGNSRKWTKHGKLPWVNYSDDVCGQPQATNKVDTSVIGTRVYKVQSGDTLSKIASRYNTTIERLLADNVPTHNKMTRNYIVVGWKLLV